MNTFRKKFMTIKNWPLDERPREKLLRHGEKNLSDAELIAIFIQSGFRGKNAIDLARELLMEFGSLKKFLSTPFHLLSKKKGLGKARYAMLKAAVEIGKRFSEENIPLGEVLRNSQLTKKFLINRLKDYSHEVFACLFLDNHHRLLAFEELFHGTINEATVYPREVVKKGLAHNAVKIILAHNHPSGNSEPSQADHEITKILKESLAMIHIQLIDHIIVGNSEMISFAEQGWI